MIDITDFFFFMSLCILIFLLMRYLIKSITMFSNIMIDYKKNQKDIFDTCAICILMALGIIIVPLMALIIPFSGDIK
ncbi:MAG: hypothetical protein ACI9AR_000129 [Flavobacteriaceae bacterium]|jgi:hypothetical protein